MTARFERAFAERLSCLERVVELGSGRLREEIVADARGVLARARERLAAGDHLVVAGLLGGTGSGKSSVFNALVGRPLAPVGPVRPVTGDSRAAAIGEAAAAGRLLDWLGIDHRHHLAPGPGLPEGLVLVDLPDHDSIALEHALMADRFAERLDLLLWVVDPIKYAHGALYDRYLRRLVTLAGVTVVVLNRVDELGEADRLACARDLRRRLDDERLHDAELVLTSATAGTGVEELRTRLIHEADRRRAAAQRISGDMQSVAARAADDLGSLPPLDTLPVAPVTGALAAALDVPGAASEAATAYRRAALAGSRSPAGAAAGAALRPLQRAVRDALQWLPVGRGSTPSATDTGLGPHPAAVRRALLDLGDAVAASSRNQADRRLRETVMTSAEPLLEQAALALRAAVVPPPRRRWWRLLALLPAAAEMAVALALLWLLALRVPLLQLPEPAAVPAPVGEVPLPTVLLLGGALARVLAGGLRRSLVKVRAGRHRRAVTRSLEEAVEGAVQDRVVAPLREELDAMSALAGAVECAGAVHHQRGGRGVTPSGRA